MDFSPHYKNKTVLVTGHTGFKGAWLSEWLLMLGARVVAEKGHPIPRLMKHPGGGDAAEVTYSGKPHGSPRADSTARGVRTFRSVSLQRKHNNQH